MIKLISLSFMFSMVSCVGVGETTIINGSLVRSDPEDVRGITRCEIRSPEVSFLNRKYIWEAKFKDLPALGKSNPYYFRIGFFKKNDKGERDYVQISPQDRKKLIVVYSVRKSSGDIVMNLTSNLGEWIAAENPIWANEQKIFKKIRTEYWADGISNRRLKAERDAGNIYLFLEKGELYESKFQIKSLDPKLSLRGIAVEIKLRTGGAS